MKYLSDKFTVTERRILRKPRDRQIVAKLDYSSVFFADTGESLKLDDAIPLLRIFKKNYPRNVVRIDGEGFILQLQSTVYCVSRGIDELLVLL